MYKPQPGLDPLPFQVGRPHGQPGIGVGILRWHPGKGQGFGVKMQPGRKRIGIDLAHRYPQYIAGFAVEQVGGEAVGQRDAGRRRMRPQGQQQALRAQVVDRLYAMGLLEDAAQILRALELKDYDVVLMDLNYTRDTTSGDEGVILALAGKTSLEEVLRVTRVDDIGASEPPEAAPGEAA